MGKINFYKMKYVALELFYGLIDQGSEYDIAADQSEQYSWGREEIDLIILHLTIATRYARCGRQITERFKKRLEFYMSKAKVLNLQEYGLTNHEIKVFGEDLAEVEALIRRCAASPRSE